MRSIAKPEAKYLTVLNSDVSNQSAISPQMPLWRYIDLSKFVSLLETNALFFTRADLLGDPFEGSITAHQLALRTEIEQRRRRKGNGKGKCNLPYLSRNSASFVKDRIANTIVNCWHMNEFESAAMWGLYLSSNEGVAIQTTYSRLISSIVSTRAKQGVTTDGWDKLLALRYAAVQYINFDTEESGLSDPFIFKRSNFSHEREFRLIASDNSFRGDPHPTRFPLGGDYVPVNLNKLIEKVYIAPTAAAWFNTVVQSLIGKYGFNFQVVQSSLARSPLH